MTEACRDRRTTGPARASPRRETSTAVGTPPPLPPPAARNEAPTSLPATAPVADCRGCAGRGPVRQTAPPLPRLVVAQLGRPPRARRGVLQLPLLVLVVLLVLAGDIVDRRHHFNTVPRRHSTARSRADLYARPADVTRRVRRRCYQSRRLPWRARSSASFFPCHHRHRRILDRFSCPPSAALSSPVGRARGRDCVSRRCLGDLGGPLVKIGHPMHPRAGRLSRRTPPTAVVPAFRITPPGRSTPTQKRSCSFRHSRNPHRPLRIVPPAARLCARSSIAPAHGALFSLAERARCLSL